ncbi:MAG: hypothetical protein HW387_208 [Parachlamydiales bacterium]|nr:hypothetical protein [Parachlamydiales bacterium]
MKKWGWRTIGITVAAVIVFLWLIKAPIMSSYLSQLLGMRVSVASVSVSPTETKMSNFKIDNPWKYKGATAFQAATIQADYQWNQLRSDPTVIDRIEIDQIYLGIEFFNSSGSQNNWKEIAAKIPKREAESKEVIINELIFTNMTVEITGMGVWAKTETRTIDRMEFTNVSSKNGFPTRELIANVFGNAGLMDYIKNIIPLPGGILKMLIPFGCNEKGQATMPSPS